MRMSMRKRYRLACVRIRRLIEFYGRYSECCPTSEELRDELWDVAKEAGFVTAHARLMIANLRNP